ncbi:unnamed protein product [Owenia fusiformis]|uniref:SAC3/GANP/THP3 conserved domain-containing protein n=1 Tax=Owenia fusiformis TaxID=6347 RepID=A0A8J1ULP6_OWEFU|nr:unnamed protein product [Owenia fusiformis]CAH1788481.1 unnamed protein product [Owenia fusiformis]
MSHLQEHPMQGTCMEMCPESEIIMREKHGLLHPFEMVPETRHHKRPRASREWMVKEYSRPAAGKAEPSQSELRPPDVLLKTVNFLMDRVVPISSCAWKDVYDYVFDRLRAVRQDMVMQSIGGVEAIRILEVAIRFHIYAAYRLCTEPLARFDQKINNTHTQECMKRLLVLYDNNVTQQNYHGDTVCYHSNRDEFESIYVLHNIGNSEALLHALDIKNKIRCSKWLNRSLEISRAYQDGNYARFCKMVRLLPVILRCAVHRHTAEVQRRALGIMSVAYSSKTLKFPVEKLCHMLNFDTISDTTSILKQRGLWVADGNVIFQKTNYQDEQIDLLHSKSIENQLKMLNASDLLIDGLISSDAQSFEESFEKMNISSESPHSNPGTKYEQTEWWDE